MRDRFTDASKELEDKNAYVCETCDDFYGHGKKDRRGHDRGHHVRAGGSDERRIHEARDDESGE